MMIDPTSFAQATAISQQSSHVYTAEFPQEWCIGSVPHGGFVTSCFMRVASLHFNTTLKKQNQPNTATLHLEFLRRTEVGTAKFTVKDMKLGRQMSNIHITLSQEIEGHHREEVVGYINRTNIANEQGPSFTTRWNLDPPAASVQPSLFDTESGDPNWRELTHRPFASFRKAIQRVRIFLPRKGQPAISVSENWMCLTNGENFTNESVGFVADMFPQLIESFLETEAGFPWSDTANEQQEKRRGGQAAFWYPTVLLNLDVKKALPEEGVKWLYVRVRAKQIKNGRYDLEVILMDEHNDIVALSHHVCLAVPAARNLAKRNRSVAREKKEENSKL